VVLIEIDPVQSAIAFKPSKVAELLEASAAGTFETRSQSYDF
jgi:hypothetical protein